MNKADYKKDWELQVPSHKKSFELVCKFFLKLMEANQKVNFYSRKMTPEQLWSGHIIDSALALPYLEDKGSLVDFGTGGGLPGVILGLCLKRTKVFLVDKSSKKNHYLKQVLQELKTRPFKISESLDGLGMVDTFTSRAVASTPKLLDIIDKAKSFSVGRVLLYKGLREKAEAELAELETKHQVEIFDLPAVDMERCLVQIGKGLPQK